MPSSSTKEAALDRKHDFAQRLSEVVGKLSRYPLPPPPSVRPWQELPSFLETLDTLDIVLFSCPISWYSMEMQGGVWTHVGMIYRRDGVNLRQQDDLADDGRGGSVLLVESVLGREEERKNGVDLIDARHRLLQYFDDNHPEVKKWERKQYIAFRKLDIERTPELLEKVEKEYLRHKGKPYEENFGELLRSMIDCFDKTLNAFSLNKKEGADSLFCSELVACLYQSAGLLLPYQEGGIIPNEFSPCDYSSEFAQKLPLIRGKLGPEICFGFPQPPSLPQLPQKEEMPSSTLRLFNKSLAKLNSKA